MSRVYEASFRMHKDRTDLQKWLAEYVVKADKADRTKNLDRPEVPFVDFQEAQHRVILSYGVTVDRAHEKSCQVSGHDGGVQTIQYYKMDLADMLILLLGLEEYLISIDEMQKPNWIPATQCKDGYVYLLDSRNLSYGKYDARDARFVGIRHKFGDEFLDSEYHFDTGDGTAKPLKEHGDIGGARDSALMSLLKDVAARCYEPDKALLI